MVGPGEVDDDLEPEVKDECNTKYGEVVQVVIFEQPNVPSDEAVRIFVEFRRIESAIKGECFHSEFLLQWFERKGTVLSTITKSETRIPKYICNQKHTDYTVTWTRSIAIYLHVSLYFSIYLHNAKWSNKNLMCFWNIITVELGYKIMKGTEYFVS